MYYAEHFVDADLLVDVGELHFVHFVVAMIIIALYDAINDSLNKITLSFVTRLEITNKTRKERALYIVHLF